MRSSKLLALFLLILAAGLLAACGGGGGGKGSSSSSNSSSSSAPSSNPAVSLAAPSGSNVMLVTVNGSTCSAEFNAAYPNKPCVSVEICDGTGNNCVTVSDILLDTGDSGLRVFQQAITEQPNGSALLTALGISTDQTYECVEYGDGSTVWGPVATAQVYLGGESPVSVPIQITGSSTSDLVSGQHACSGRSFNLLSTPDQANYHGSLGLGLLVQDGGAYYNCTGNSCTSITPVNQVQNPVASLIATSDDNGVIIALPSVPSAGTGVISATGYVIFGINTETNNVPSGVTAYGINNSDPFVVPFFTTTYKGTTNNGFLDTGSNGIFFADSSIPQTTDGYFYAPSSTLSLSATNTGADALNASGVVDFSIANADTLFLTANNVFSNLGGPSGDTSFDWGLPFFLGRTVYVGIDGKTSSLGTGPYWAY